MPNWVHNNLTIAPNAEAGGTIKDVADAIEQVGRAYVRKAYDWKTSEVVEHTVDDPGLAFWNIVRPEGEALEMYEESMTKPAASPYWYDWNCENWGTKWDASDVDLHDYEPDHKRFTFSTPWSPPLPVLTALSAQHPNLHIELEWEEEQGFGGTFVFRDGEATETNYYDIPSSHADYVERDREDQCVCTWIDDPESFYSDCPSAVKNEQAISPDELEVEAMI